MYDFLIAAKDSPYRVRSIADILCDGNSDQDRIMDCLDYGSVKLGMGNFSISNTITVPEGAIIGGSGRTRTIISQPKTTKITVGRPMILLKSNSICENISVNGNAWTERDIDTNGIKLENNATLRNSEIFEVRQYAIYTYAAKGAKVVNNVMHHTKYPFAFTGGDSNLSEGCLGFGNYTYNTDYYIKVRHSKDCTVTFNTIINTGINAGTKKLANTPGIDLCGGDGKYFNITVSHNHLIDKQGVGDTSGIYIQDDANSLSCYNHITNNVIEGYKWGIRVGADNTTVENNLMINCRDAGIWVQGKNSRLLGNTTEGCIIRVDEKALGSMKSYNNFNGGL